MTTIAKIEKAAPLRNQVLAEVTKALRAGTFLPGERLTEARVAEVLGVSRTPVREALHLLAERGTLARREGGGYAVATPGAKEIEDTFELRRRLEPYAARRAAELATAEQLKGLKAALVQLRELVNEGTPAQFMQTNEEFRTQLYGLAGNAPLSAAIAQLNDHVHFIGMLTIKDVAIRRLVISKHQRIVTAVSKGDAEAAEQATNDYLDAARASLIAALPKNS